MAKKVLTAEEKAIKAARKRERESKIEKKIEKLKAEQERLVQIQKIGIADFLISLTDDTCTADDLREIFHQAYYTDESGRKRVIDLDEIIKTRWPRYVAHREKVEKEALEKAAEIGRKAKSEKPKKRMKKKSDADENAQSSVSIAAAVEEKIVAEVTNDGTGDQDATGENSTTNSEKGAEPRAWKKPSVYDLAE